MEPESYEDATPVDEAEASKVQARINTFKRKMSILSSDTEIVQEFILHGSSYALEDDQTFAIKKKISTRWDVHPSKIFVVGSAKTGFSIAPAKRYRHFGETSDVDVAIVDHELYERIWHELHIHKESGGAWRHLAQFERFAAWGWIRPDKLPSSKDYKLSRDWWGFFESLKKERVAGPLKLAAAVYHDISFLERYQVKSVAACRQLLETGV